MHDSQAVPIVEEALKLLNPELSEKFSEGIERTEIFGSNGVPCLSIHPSDSSAEKSLRDWFRGADIIRVQYGQKTYDVNVIIAPANEGGMN